MDENLVNLSQFQIRFCFFEEISRAELSAFQRVRRGLVYLSGESRPSLAFVYLEDNGGIVYLSGESRPSLASDRCDGGS